MFLLTYICLPCRIIFVLCYLPVSHALYICRCLLVGLDIPKHGEPSYPAEAYGHGWGEKGDTLFTMVKRANKLSRNSLKHGKSVMMLDSVLTFVLYL